MSNHLVPGDDQYLPFFHWWVEQGKPRRFNKGSAQWRALTNGDHIEFILESYTGIDATTSFNKVLR